MTSLELYYESQLLLNKNATNVNINLEKENFVWLFNREAKRWLTDYIAKYSSNYFSTNIQSLIRSDVELALVFKGTKYNTYELPADYNEFIHSHSLAVKDECSTTITNFLIKPKTISAELDSSFSSPSFEYEESICNIAGNKVEIYKKEYEINSAYLSYYKNIEDIDIEGYQKLDDTWSTTIDTDLDPYIQSQIIDRVVIEVMRQFENGGGYKLSADRLQN